MIGDWSYQDDSTLVVETATSHDVGISRLIRVR